MAVMIAADREKARRAFVEEICTAREVMAGLTKADVLAAINATDQWISDNQASFNTALPLAARNGLTQAQKARLFSWVVKQRFLSGL